MKFNIILFAIFSLTALTPAMQAQEKTKTPSTEKNGATGKKKVYFTKDGKGNTGSEGTQPEISVLVEYISIDAKSANELLGKFVSKATDVVELRDSLEQSIDKGKATLIETMWVRSRSGQRAQTKSVQEHSYPSYYDPPMLPYVGTNDSPKSDNKKNEPADPVIHMTHASPTALEYRDVGTTLEIDPILSTDHKIITVSLSPEIVTRLKDQYFTREGFEKTAWGVDNISMPNFYTIKDTSQIEVAPGKYNLLGIHTPHDDKKKRILVLLRADLISFD